MFTFFEALQFAQYYSRAHCLTPSALWGPSLMSKILLGMLDRVKSISGSIGSEGG